MSYIYFIRHLAFGLFLFIFSTGIAWAIMQRKNIMDTPNQRSSHTMPTATSGGLAIVLTFFLGMGILYFIGDETMIKSRFFFGFTFSSLLIAGMSLYDDYRDKPFLIRLLTQILGIIVVMSFGIVINRIDFPGFDTPFMTMAGYFLTFFWILGLTNAYNFMDGLNGIAGGTAVIAALFLGIISYDQGSNFTYMVCYALLAGTAGFLVFNFPRGKLFMGDVGSTFLGFSFATLAIISSLYDNAHTSLLVVPLLLFHFIFDTFFTFVRRYVSHENVFHAHRSHLYQLLNRLGYSHTFVTLFYCTLGVVQGLGAYWMVHISGSARILIFIPYLIFNCLYAAWVILHAKKKKLL